MVMLFTTKPYLLPNDQIMDCMLHLKPKVNTKMPQEATVVTKYLHTSVAIKVLQTTNENSKCKTNLDFHADTSVVGDSRLIVHNHGRLVDVYGYDNDRHKHVRTVDAVIGYQHTCLRYINLH